MNLLPFLVMLLQGATNSPNVATPSPTPTPDSSLISQSSATVIAAAIAGVAAVTAALITAYMTKQTALKKLEKADESAQEAAKSVEGSMLDRVGFKETVVSVVTEITNVDGSCQMTWDRQGVKITQPGTSLPHIPLMVAYGTPDAVIDPDFPKLITYSFKRPIELRRLSFSDKECVFSIDIPGSFTSDDGELGYTYKVEASKCFYMTKEAVDAGDDTFKREYVSFEVVSPLDRLELKVVFPENYPPDSVSPGVFMGPVMSDGLMSGRELRRIEPNFHKVKGVAQLTVEQPLVGFRYLIYWTPPTKSVVDALKKGGVL